MAALIRDHQRALIALHQAHLDDPHNERYLGRVKHHEDAIAVIREKNRRAELRYGANRKRARESKGRRTVPIEIKKARAKLHRLRYRRNKAMDYYWDQIEAGVNVPYYTALLEQAQEDYNQAGSDLARLDRE